MSDALRGLRVLDLSGPSGQYCGKMFADLGADVILVEPPTGSPVRGEGPFVEGRVDAEYSLPFAYFNAGKRGICLDLQTTQGQEALRRLAITADILIESEKPGVMAARGLDYASLSTLNPMLVMTSITPFGQTGPYAAYEADDIVALAMGGMLHLGGYHDSQPIAAYGNQAYLAAAQFAAVASVMAAFAAERQSKAGGRHIDVSIQECVVMGMENAVQFYDLEGVVRRREAGQQRWAGTGVFDCADGQVYVMAGGIVPAQFREANVRWLIDEGVHGAERMLEPQWASQDFQMTAEAKQIFLDLFGPFARARTKDDLYRAGQARRIPICPINTPRDLAENRQLAARGFLTDLPHPASGRTLQAPGAPYQLSGTPWRGGRAAPRLGEHTAEIFQELAICETAA